jgi:hypothetical protein
MIKLDVEGMHHRCSKSTPNMILNGEKLKVESYSKIQNKISVLTFTTSILYRTTGPIQRNEA